MFSEHYGQTRALTASAGEDVLAVSEYRIQCLWQDQAFPEAALATHEGLSLRVLSPGWWNHQEGPDFREAQIEFGGRLRTGDVEVHLTHAGWQAHGHHLDPHYDNVILHVVLESEAPRKLPVTSAGRPIPVLLLRRHVTGELQPPITEDAFRGAAQMPGLCCARPETGQAEPLHAAIKLAGEWRMLNKARALRERMEQAGTAQAVYESFLYACGFLPFKHPFRAIARQLPYERARQLALQDPLLLEAAFLQLAGLLPAPCPEDTVDPPHYARLCALRQRHLSGLKSLALAWRRTGVRPVNFPERRLAGAALFLARTAREGLVESLEAIWRGPSSPIERRRRFEALFPKALGFWAAHCTWTGKQMNRESAPIGPARVRSIIGNVFVPAALALARRNHDRDREETVFAFFTALPPEQENRITKTMLPRFFGAGLNPKPTFQLQQGLLQLHQDWCESNPSCRNCSLLAYLDRSPSVAVGAR